MTSTWDTLPLDRSNDFKLLCLFMARMQTSLMPVPAWSTEIIDADEFEDVELALLAQRWTDFQKVVAEHSLQHLMIEMAVRHVYIPEERLQPVLFSILNLLLSDDGDQCFFNIRREDVVALMIAWNFYVLDFRPEVDDEDCLMDVSTAIADTRQRTAFLSFLVEYPEGEEVIEFLARVTLRLWCRFLPDGSCDAALTDIAPEQFEEHLVMLEPEFWSGEGLNSLNEPFSNIASSELLIAMFNGQMFNGQGLYVLAEMMGLHEQHHEARELNARERINTRDLDNIQEEFQRLVEGILLECEAALISAPAA